MVNSCVALLEIKIPAVKKTIIMLNANAIWNANVVLMLFIGIPN